MDPKLSNLLQWATLNGSTIDPLLDFQISSDRGILANYKKTLTEASPSPQLAIPIDLILTNELSNKYFQKKIETGNPNSSLKLFLAKLKYDTDGWDNTNSDEIDYQKHFQPYVDLLPVGAQSGSCFYWNEEELKMLENTNLGGSLDLKLHSLVNEWRDSILELPEAYRSDKNFQDDLNFYTEFKTLSRNDLLKELLNISSWKSFAAYLWSSYIFTSRAFPNHIINSDCKDGQAILLPVIDLLNHDNSTKVNWTHTVTADKEYFSLHNLDLLQEGSEVFNNYGAKGNEELLMGYGFVIEDNKNNSVALRVKLPIDVIRSAEKIGITIPSIDDYTYHSFQNSTSEVTDSKISDDDIKDGLLYFINESNLIPDNLLSLFQYLASKPFESGSSLRAKLQALQDLKRALEQKLKPLKKDPSINPELTDEYRVHSALIYRGDQQKLCKASISQIKSLEKELLRDYKTHFLNLKSLYAKLYERDTPFQELLAVHWGITNPETIELEDFVDVAYFIWIILHGESSQPEDYYGPKWVIDHYKTLKAENADVTYDSFSDLEDYLQKHFANSDVGPALTKRNLALANKALTDNCYTRLNTGEPILVDHIEL